MKLLMVSFLSLLQGLRLYLADLVPIQEPEPVDPAQPGRILLLILVAVVVLLAVLILIRAIRRRRK